MKHSELKMIGNTLRSLRESKGLSLICVAKFLNKASVYLEEIENGNRVISKRDYDVLLELFPELIIFDCYICEE